MWSLCVYHSVSNVYHSVSTVYQSLSNVYHSLYNVYHNMSNVYHSVLTVYHNKSMFITVCPMFIMLCPMFIRVCPMFITVCLMCLITNVYHTVSNVFSLTDVYLCVQCLSQPSNVYHSLPMFITVCPTFITVCSTFITVCPTQCILIFQIMTEADCRNETYEPFCRANIDVSNFLNMNSLLNHDLFCLAYLFTYRDFSQGTLGLAWVGSASSK